MEIKKFAVIVTKLWSWEASMPNFGALQCLVNAVGWVFWIRGVSSSNMRSPVEPINNTYDGFGMIDMGADSRNPT